MLGFIVTGRAAHARVGRLFQDILRDSDQGQNQDSDDASLNEKTVSPWVDLSPYSEARDVCLESSDLANDIPLSFLWENSPRLETKRNRDLVNVYSHLPNGTNILDDKWVLARLLGTPANHFNDNDHSTSSLRSKLFAPSISNDNADLATLESHCFRGADFITFAIRVGLISFASSDAAADGGVESRKISDSSKLQSISDIECLERNNTHQQIHDYFFEDLISTTSVSIKTQGSETRAFSVPPSPENLWVIKDAMSNGAGGIWILDPSNIHEFLDETEICKQPNSRDAALKGSNIISASDTTSVLHPTHRYVAQRYAWPPTLYDGRKCHLRVYGLITSSGKAFVHRRAFLHVANEKFDYFSTHTKSMETNSGKYDSALHRNHKFDSSVHITNCCTNSHDIHKFTGEICADLILNPSASQQYIAANTQKYERNDIPLGHYFPSIAASVAALTKRSAPFVNGGQKNNGFEYLGLDYLLSSVPDPTAKHSTTRKPVAYLLEVNAPPSQDTATGLPHAESLHDEVISDLLRMCVLPNLSKVSPECGGWQCVYVPEEQPSVCEVPPVPSKAAFIGKIRWALYEKKAKIEYERLWCKSTINSLDKNHHFRKSECESIPDSFDADAFVSFVRSQFPYFSESTTAVSLDKEHLSGAIFFESGGGAQVPTIVMNAVVESMSCRDRSLLGARIQKKARLALLSLITGADLHDDNNDRNLVIMGANATSILDNLARQYCRSGMLNKGDEIIIASENHTSNVHPWITAAKATGATVKWWTIRQTLENPSMIMREFGVIESSILSELVSTNTKIVAVSHASNILGCVRDITSICELVHRVTKNKGHVVVDGVAASPHLLSPGVFYKADLSLEPDWYVVSLHKLFGPHLGCMIGKRCTVLQLTSRQEHASYTMLDEVIYKSWEQGTINYEACAGVCALEEYFRILASEVKKHFSVIRHTLNRCNPKNCAMVKRSNQDEISIQHEKISDYPLPQQHAQISIWKVETRLLIQFLNYLQICSPSVQIIQDLGLMQISDQVDQNVSNVLGPTRLPIVSFLHDALNSCDIVQHCRSHGIICRACNFLSTDRLWKEIGIENTNVVRFSLAHYNTRDEIDRAICVLEMIDGWRVPSRKVSEHI